MGVLAAVSMAYWLFQAVMAWWSARVVPVFSRLPVLERTRWPTVSLIIPARNEAAHVQAALRARLAEGYPALEVVVVDDRSTDDTAAQVRALADPRVTVTRVEVLPEGWLGKLNALREGLAVARGEWILFSDADVHLAPGTLARLIAWAEAESVDHVAALPSTEPGTVGTRFALECFFRFIVAFSRLWGVARRDSSAAVGVGAFNLFRRRALEQTPGLEALKLRIDDDMALGLMLKKSGAAQRVVVAREAVSLQFYASLRELARALEKNGATAPVPVMLLALTVLLALELGWWGLFAVDARLALGCWAFNAAVGAGVARWLGNAAWPAVLPGLGTVPLAVVLARSVLLAWRRGGVVWRGTFYTRASLRS